MTLNKYQKANAFIHLSEDQKDAMTARILAARPEVRKPEQSRWKLWLPASLAFAAVVLFMAVIVKPSDKPSLTMNDSAPASAVTAGGYAESEDAAQPSQIETESFSAVSETYGAKGRKTEYTLTICSPTEEKEDLQKYGEKKTTVIEGQEVVLYGNQAAAFDQDGEHIQIVMHEPSGEEELCRITAEVIRSRKDLIE